MKKKLHYIPGLISLIFLLPLCYFYLSSKGAFKKYSIIEITYWNPETAKYFTNFYKDVDPYKPQPERNYQSFILTGIEKDDRKTLLLAQEVVRKQNLSNDTVNGVHFHFSENAKYWSYIKVLDIFQQENVKLFLPFKNDIWLFDFPKQPVLGNCGTTSSENTITESKTKVEPTNLSIGLFFKEFWAAVLMFCLLVLSTFNWSKKILPPTRHKRKTSADGLARRLY